MSTKIIDLNDISQDIDVSTEDAKQPGKSNMLRSIADVFGGIGEGISAARQCKTLTDSGIAPADAVRRVFETAIPH